MLELSCFNKSLVDQHLVESIVITPLFIILLIFSLKVREQEKASALRMREVFKRKKAKKIIEAAKNAQV